MTETHQQKVLIVDNDAQIKQALCSMLEMEKIQFAYADTGESALEILKTAPQPFCLIISGQQLTGMQGTQFLEHARRLNPNTIRFLLTSHSQMQTIINAVNQGAVQRYLSKPWDNDEMLQAIQSGIEQYEQFLENEKLVSLAKKQNAKLYELTCELMEATKTHEKELITIDAEIEAIKKQLEEVTSQTAASPALLMEELTAILASAGETPQETLTTLFSQTITTLFNDFHDLALRNGFEMPTSGKERSDA